MVDNLAPLIKEDGWLIKKTFVADLRGGGAVVAVVSFAESVTFRVFPLLVVNCLSIVIKSRLIREVSAEGHLSQLITKYRL